MCDAIKELVDVGPMLLEVTKVLLVKLPCCC
jgi:hypothetical protein